MFSKKILNRKEFLELVQKGEAGEASILFQTTRRYWFQKYTWWDGKYYGKIDDRLSPINVVSNETN